MHANGLPPPTTVTCVGAVVTRDNALLAVRQARGHDLQGQWTIPWGRLEDGESPTVAAVRETREEAGVEVIVQGLLGIQELPSPWEGWNAIIFLCSHAGGSPKPDSRETDAARYFTLSEFRALDEPIEPLSAWLLDRVFSNRHTIIDRSDENPFSPSASFL